MLNSPCLSIAALSISTTNLHHSLPPLTLSPTQSCRTLRNFSFLKTKETFSHPAEPTHHDQKKRAVADIAFICLHPIPPPYSEHFDATPNSDRNEMASPSLPAGYMRISSVMKFIFDHCQAPPHAWLFLQVERSSWGSGLICARVFRIGRVHQRFHELF